MAKILVDHTTIQSMLGLPEDFMITSMHTDRAEEVKGIRLPKKAHPPWKKESNSKEILNRILSSVYRNPKGMCGIRNTECGIRKNDYKKIRERLKKPYQGMRNDACAGGGNR